jgi:hypothetical protein
VHGETSWATYEFTGSPPTGEWSGGLNDFGLKAYNLISLCRDYPNLDLSIFEKTICANLQPALLALASWLALATLSNLMLAQAG